MTQSVTCQPINDATLALFPALVASIIQEFAINRTDDTLHYLEVVGVLDRPSCQRMRDQIQSWIGDDDSRCCYFVYLGGSACWICLGTQSALLFDLIQPTLLPPISDPYVWWVIKSERQLEVYKIAVQQVIEDKRKLRSCT